MVDPSAWLFARVPRLDEESPSKQKRSEVTACDQRLDVPFDGVSDRANLHDPDLDVTQLGGIGKVCRTDEGLHAVDNDALRVKAGA